MHSYAHDLVLVVTGLPMPIPCLRQFFIMSGYIILYFFFMEVNHFYIIPTNNSQVCDIHSCDSFTLFSLYTVYTYTAKLLFHQSPTRHSDYMVTTTVTM